MNFASAGIYRQESTLSATAGGQGMESHEVHFFHDQAGGGREKNNVINCIILSASFRAQNRRKDADFSFRHF
jgi:hypothetical protein